MYNILEFNIDIKNEDEVRELVNFANTFKSPIDLIRGSRSADCKSILGVIAIGMFEPCTISINTHDEDEMVRFVREVTKFEKKR